MYPYHHDALFDGDEGWVDHHERWPKPVAALLAQPYSRGWGLGVWKYA